jgi:inorganic pyrophosphatase
MALEKIWKEIRLILKSHPWHGVPIGSDYPSIVNSFIEIVPTDTVKYEVDKASGYLKIDRPQMYSNVCPTPYGFIPQTLCSTRIGKYCEEKTGKIGIKGDGDPLDICVLTEKPITHNDILLKAVPIGGLRLIDGDEADDKIIAVMHKDPVYGEWKDISDSPGLLVDRLQHYFLTYKQAPGSDKKHTEITHIYGKEEAFIIIQKSYEDYLEKYSSLNDLLLNNF